MRILAQKTMFGAEERTVEVATDGDQQVLFNNNADKGLQECRKAEKDHKEAGGKDFWITTVVQ